MLIEISKLGDGSRQHNFRLLDIIHCTLERNEDSPISDSVRIAVPKEEMLLCSTKEENTAITDE